jgi:hypothetical protein
MALSSEALMESYIALSNDFKTLSTNFETRIGALEAQRDLSFSLISQIYKSHLAKAASRLIFWSLHNRLGYYVSPEQITMLDALVEVLMNDKYRHSRRAAEEWAMLLFLPGPRQGIEFEIVESVREPTRKAGKYTPYHFYNRTTHNTIGEVSSSVLAQLSQDVSHSLHILCLFTE